MNSGMLRPRAYGAMNWIGLRTLAAREVQRFWKVKAQTLIAPLVSTVLFMAVFAIAFGRGNSPFPGVPYADFLAPGLIMMAVINNAFQNASSSLIIAKIQGNSVDFLMPPLSAAELTFGFLAGAVARGMLVGFVSVLAVAFFADVRPQHLWAVVWFSLSASVIFGAIGLLGGIWSDKFDNLAAVANFVVTPLTFLSGTFYSIDRLPGAFAAFGHANPVFFMIDGFRYGFIGHADGDLVTGFTVTAGLSLVLVWACYAVLKSGWKLKA